MPDGRFISRQIAHSEQLGGVSLAADYLFTRSIPHLDCEGRMSGNPTLVKSTVCPLRPEINEEVIPGLLAELDSAGLIHWFEADGKQVVEFPTFKSHQKGLRADREAVSRFPAYQAPQLRSKSGPTPDELPPKLSEVKSKLSLSEVKSGAEAPEPGSAPSLPTADQPPTTEVEDVASLLIRHANRGMAENPAIDQQRFRPIVSSHGSRSYVVEWLTSGIPAKLIQDTIGDRARAFQPNGRNTQISTMRYFESAVLDAYDKQCLTSSEAGQITVELPRSPAKRSGTLTRVDGTDPDAEAARRARLEDQAIQKWAAEHPKDEAEIMESLSAEVSKDFGGGPIGGRTMELVVKSRYRTAVLARITPPLKLVKP